jgi:RimJ/RimL family protein N-acetyltransferase
LSEMIYLRDILENDLAIFYEHQRQPEANRMAGFTPRNRKKFMEHWKKILNNPDIIKKTIVHDRKIAGNILCFRQDDKQLIGYWLGKEFWGRGIATEALALFLEKIPFRPLYAYVVAHNIGSIRVLEKCGFELVHEIVKEHTLQEDATDELLYMLEK